MRNIRFHALAPDLTSKARKEQAEWSGDRLGVQKLKKHKWGYNGFFLSLYIKLEGNKTVAKYV